MMVVDEQWVTPDKAVQRTTFLRDVASLYVSDEVFT